MTRNDPEGTSGGVDSLWGPLRVDEGRGVGGGGKKETGREQGTGIQGREKEGRTKRHREGTLRNDYPPVLTLDPIHGSGVTTRLPLFMARVSHTYTFLSWVLNRGTCKCVCVCVCVNVSDTLVLV